MIGTVAGDIIGSPYVNNPREASTEIFFTLFESSSRIESDDAHRRYRSVIYEAKEGVLSGLAKAAADWYLSGERTPESWAEIADKYLGSRHPSGTEVLAVCGPLAKLCAGVDEAQALSGILITELKPRDLDLASAAEHYLEMAFAMKAKNDAEFTHLHQILGADGYEFPVTSSESRPFLTGTVTKGEDGKLVLGSGKPVTDAHVVLPAVYNVLNECQTYEEAVRRAVALGGNSSLTAALVGGIAELRWGVPEFIKERTLDYFSAEERNLNNRIDNYLKGEQHQATEKRRTAFRVIKVEGMNPIYVIPAGMRQMRKAVKELNAKLGRSDKDYTVITPEQAKETMRRLGEQRDSRGTVLDGTYVEHPRPEMKPLWLQKGEVRSSTTREGEGMDGGALLPVTTRKSIFSEWQKLCDYANDVRCQLEKQAGFVGAEGQHLHFATAMYPVVKEQTIEVWQGDVLRARVGINVDGRFKVDSNALTGGVHTEGLDGVLSTMNLLSKNASMKDVKQMLDEYILDYGRIEDEQEREILKTDDAEADSVKRKYRSNVDMAMDDLSRGLSENEEGALVLPTAVMPEGSLLSEGTREVIENRREESRREYGGESHYALLDRERNKGAIFTIGHSNLKQEEFDALMKRHGIQVLVDVRTFTDSKFAPQFNGDTLDSHLAGKDIEYYHFPELSAGRTVKETDAEGKAVTRKLTYDEIIATPEFSKGLKDIRESVRNGYRVCLMDTVGTAYDSPRFAMLGRALEHPDIYDKRVKPVSVVHITRKGYTVSQEDLELGMMKDYGMASGDLTYENGMISKELNECYVKRENTIKEKDANSRGISLKRNAENKKQSQQQARRAGYRRKMR